MNKTDLIQKIKQLDGLTQDERSTLIELVNTKKKYGLVWEDKPEEVEEQLRTQLPVLKEVVEKRIIAPCKPLGSPLEETGKNGLQTGKLATNGAQISKPLASPLQAPSELVQGTLAEAGKNGLQTSLFKPEEVKKEDSINSPTETTGEAPNHILIEGDNLHALTSFTFTHEKSINLIYIDPPYNTGKLNEFKYNDKWVDGEDTFRHSKWLSFIKRRIELAYNLLSESGVLFVSIDDNELAQLKMLLDEIFDKRTSNPKNSNCLGILIWDLGTGTSAGHFTRSNEFILAYCKNKYMLPNFSGGEGIIDDRAQKKISIKNPESIFTFPKGTKVEAQDGFELIGTWGGRERSTLISGRFKCINGFLVEPITISAGWTQKRQMKSYFEGEETYDSKGQKIVEFYFKDNGKIYCRKERDKLNPPSVLRNIATTKQGTSVLKEIFNGEEPIKFVKPVQLIKYLLELFPNNIKILDFFAGSGTTLQATMQLNAEDGGTRQCILITNNENNICEEVTYERNRRVIEGYTNSKGQWIEGLRNNNLRYYRSEFVDREPSIKNKRELTRMATELLCIKEDCYEEQKMDDEKNIRYFCEKEKRFMVVYDDMSIENAVEIIKQLVTTENIAENGIKVYVFSPGQYPFTEEFEEVRKWIKLCALPDAIYKAYMNVLPKKTRKVLPVIEEESEETIEPNLFE